MKWWRVPPAPFWLWKATPRLSQVNSSGKVERALTGSGAGPRGATACRSGGAGFRPDGRREQSPGFTLRTQGPPLASLP